MNVFTVACAIACGLQCVCFGQQYGAWPPNHVTVEHAEPTLAEAGSEFTILRPETQNELVGQTKLYSETDQETDSRSANEDENYPFDLDDDFRKRRSETPYPSLYSPERAAGVIVVIGYPECGWCKQQLRVIPGHDSFLELETKDYRVIYVDRNKADPLNKSVNPPTWDGLREKLELPKVYPTTLIVEKGRITKTFSGFKPWLTIEPFAKAAKKNDAPEPQPLRRLRLFFPPGPEPTPARRGSSDSRRSSGITKPGKR